MVGRAIDGASSCQFRLQAARLGVLQAQRRNEAITCVRYQFSTGIRGTEHGVPERFSRLVGLLSGPVGVEAQFAFVEDILCCLPGLIDPLFDLVPDRHGALLRKG